MYLSKVLLWIALFFIAMTACTEQTPEAIEIARAEAPKGPSLIRLTQTQLKQEGMRLGMLERRAFKSTIRTTGSIEVPPTSRAMVSSYFGGYVQAMRLFPGQAVRKGELLIRLENPDFLDSQREFLEIQGQLGYLEAALERQESLLADQVTSEKEFLKARADYQTALVRYEALKKELQLMGVNPENLKAADLKTTLQLVAPITGLVEEVLVTQGMFLEPGATAVKLLATNDLHLELRVFERDLSKIKAGQSIEFTIQSAPEQRFQAKVLLMHPTMDAEQHTATIHADFSPLTVETRFLPGMYVEATLFTNDVQQLALPENAVLEEEGRSVVLLQVATDGEELRFQKQEVQVGRRYDGFVEIRNANDFEKRALFLVEGGFGLQ